MVIWDKNVKNLRFYYGTKDYKGKKQVLSTAYYKQDYISFTKAEGTITEVASESLKAGKKYSRQARKRRVISCSWKETGIRKYYRGTIGKRMS